MLKDGSGRCEECGNEEACVCEDGVNRCRTCYGRRHQLSADDAIEALVTAGVTNKNVYVGCGFN